jgi:hypothetical protein
MVRSHLCFIALLISLSAATAAPSIAAKRDFSINAPAQQSECEIKSVKIRSAHPGLDMFKLMNRYGVMIFGPAIPPVPPITYRDAQSGVIFYVESDGRHVAALDQRGKLLWVRNPFVDSNMCPYRSAHPFIISLEDARGGWQTPDYNASIRDMIIDAIKRGTKATPPEKAARFVFLRFNSSQMGYLNIGTGDFFFAGQN